MADYSRLPPLSVVAAADTTGKNPGNWTITVDLSTLTNLTEYECYHASIDGPVGFGVAWYINNKQWSHTSQGWQNEWDPSEPALLRNSDTLYLYWAAPTTAVPVPTATFWFRYDVNLPPTGPRCDRASRRAERAAPEEKVTQSGLEE